MLNQRLLYLLSAIPVMLAGLASRKYREQLPTFLAEYAGDTLWAMTLFLLLSAIVPHRSLLARAAIALALAFIVELSQLYHAPWLDSIRQTTLGALVLGFGFLWTDLVCYTIGIALAVMAQLLITARMKASREV